MKIDTSMAGLAPVRAKARIDVLDILRGLAILGILFINVPYMAAPVWQFSADIRSIGWTPADQTAWAFINIFFAGTQRCMLQFLFGAGMMVLAKKAMTPDGPVAVSDLYYRRNMWLLAFGLGDVFVLLWPGDILHIYALAALFLFPFRNLSPKWLLGLGLSWAVLFAVGIPDYGAREYIDRTNLVHQVHLVEAKEQAGSVLTADDRATIGEWQKLQHHAPEPDLQQRIASERKAHAGGFIPYAKEAWSYWSFLASQWLVWDVIEAFCTMLIGVALWKWGVIQGQRSRDFYVGLAIACYAFGVTARWYGVAETLSFSTGPRTLWITGEFSRLAIGLGHLALVNWAVQTRPGAAMLAPFKASGRMAFSLYFMQQFVGKYILFAPFAFNLWGRFGWADMAMISAVGITAQVIIANLWFRWFTAGPLEWIWRSLAYVKLQPILKPRLSAQPLPDRASPSDPSAVAAEGPAAP